MLTVGNIPCTSVVGSNYALAVRTIEPVQHEGMFLISY